MQTSTLTHTQDTLHETQEKVRGLEENLALQRENLHNGEMERRRLHNTIQELKVSPAKATDWPLDYPVGLSRRITLPFEFITFLGMVEEIHSPFQSVSIDLSTLLIHHVPVTNMIFNRGTSGFSAE